MQREQKRLKFCPIKRWANVAAVAVVAVAAVAVVVVAVVAVAAAVAVSVVAVSVVAVASFWVARSKKLLKNTTLSIWLLDRCSAYYTS